jgi:putative transcriptional regulator
MTKIAHHPSEETLAACAAGTLDEARALVVKVHLSLCGACSREVGRFEAIGGALLDAAPPASLRPGALDEALLRLDASDAEPGRPADPLDRYRLGKWRWVGPGVYRR